MHFFFLEQQSDVSLFPTTFARAWVEMALVLGPLLLVPFPAVFSHAVRPYCCISVGNPWHLKKLPQTNPNSENAIWYTARCELNAGKTDLRSEGRRDQVTKTSHVSKSCQGQSLATALSGHAFLSQGRTTEPFGSHANASTATGIRRLADEAARVL